jgi:hypothetical protein
MLKSRRPKAEPWGTPDFTRKENENVPEIRRLHRNVYYQDSYETNQHNWKTVQNY